MHNNVVIIPHSISFVNEYDQDIVSELNGIRSAVIPTKMILNSGTGITITESPNGVFTSGMLGDGGVVSDKVIAGNALIGNSPDSAFVGDAEFCHKNFNNSSGYMIRQDGQSGQHILIV